MHWFRYRLWHLLIVIAIPAVILSATRSSFRAIHERSEAVDLIAMHRLTLWFAYPDDRTQLKYANRLRDWFGDEPLVAEIWIPKNTLTVSERTFLASAFAEAIVNEYDVALLRFKKFDGCAVFVYSANEGKIKGDGSRLSTKQRLPSPFSFALSIR